MINKLIFNCGPKVNALPLQLDDLFGLTIFVGPNNSGKSALIQSLFSSIKGQGFSKPSALAEVELKPIEAIGLDSHPDFKNAHPGQSITTGGQNQTLEQWIHNLSGNWSGVWGGLFRTHFCAQMDGPQRLSMLPHESEVNLLNPIGPLARLFVDDVRRKNFQAAVFAGIEMYPVVDHMSQVGQFRLAFSTKLPETKIERGLDNASVTYFNTAVAREALSDGFNAYVGLLGTIFATDHRTILIDEPEAFLHPSLARTLGKQIATHSSERQVFVATHSSEFLMGAIESGVNVRIIRLQYQSDIGSAHLLENAELRNFMTDPILRSANVLSGLFAKAVVVTESDTDRSFYEEVNTRLLSQQDHRAIRDARFLNAQNKQTVARIVRMLRRMGIPTGGIVDLDVLCEGGTNWTNHIDSIGMPDAMRSGAGSTRATIFQKLASASTDKEQKNYKTRGGVVLLEHGDSETALSLLQSLRDYGLFVVEGGEVEQWLSNLKVPKSKHLWLHSIFDAMGADSKSANYAKPEDGDVWDFIGSLSSWFNNNKRKGMS